MSNYTTEVRYICETLAGERDSKGYTSIKEIISKSRPLIFNFDYPIYDEKYRAILEEKILLEYYNREIGLETYGLWKLRLQAKLNRIMPYYNQMYMSELIKFNPMYDVDLTTERTLENEGNTNRVNIGNYNENKDTVGNKNTDIDRNNTIDDNGNIVRSGKNTDTKNTNEWRLNSDLPQGGVQNIGLQDNSYLTDATRIINDGSVVEYDIDENVNNTNKQTSIGKTDEDTTYNDKVNTIGKNDNTEDVNVNGIQEYFEHVTGKRGGNSYSRLLLEFRQTFLNIDDMILDELSDLFMMLW